MEAVGIIESVSPVDRLSTRLAEWGVHARGELVEPQGVPYEVWVGGTRVQKPGDAEPGDAGGGDQNNEESRPTPGGTYIRYVIDPESRDVTVNVIDRASGEVTRTIPP